MTFDKPSKTKKIETGPIDLEYSILQARHTLPSKGKFYPDADVYVRGLRFREQLEAAQISNMEDTELALKSAYRLHSNCIIVPQVEYKDILLEDFVALSMWVTFLTSSSTKFSVTANCYHCEAEISTNVNVSQLELADFETFEFETVTTDVGTLLIGPKTVGEDELFSALEDIPRELNYAPMIKKLDGKELSVPERVELLGLLKKEDAIKVIGVCNRFVSGLTPITRVCKKCSQEMSIYPFIDIIKGLP